MLFSSFVFIFAFLPLTLLVYYFLKFYEKFTLAKLSLICASFIFYGYFKIEYVFILLASILINFFIANAILSLDKREREREYFASLA